MPRRRKSFKRRKSRKGRRQTRRVAGRKRSSRASTAVLRSPSGFPDRVYVKLRYVDTYTITSTLGAAAAQKWRGNGIFDPDATGSGHQPYAFDQWATLYGSYRVHGSKIRVRLVQTNNTSAFTQAMWFVVVPATENTSPTYPYPLDEMPYAKTRYIANANTGTNGMNDITTYMSTAKIAGTSKQAVRCEDDYAAATTADPANLWYWMMFVGPVDASTSTSGYAFVTIEYYVEFFDRNTLAAS